MDKIILNTTNKEQVKTIYHLADIHVRLLRRHKEYKEVFDEVLKEISKDTDQALIYLGGDIVHAKLELSPELIQLISEFFTDLARLAPVIIITGNHDMNMNNMNRLDVLTPIVDMLNDSNIHYLRDTGVYTYNNLDFYVFSVTDVDIHENIAIKQALNDKQTNIALYHGTINDSKTDKGFVLKNDYVTTSVFEQYDFTMLGDIHKYQALGIKNNIVYSSSLIQQDHGENVSNHGLVKWDVEHRTHKLIEIKNDYGYHTIHVEKGEIKPLSEPLSKKPRLRLEVKDTKLSKLKEIEAVIRKEYNVKDFVTNTINIENDLDETNSLGDISNLQDSDYQFELIHDYLTNAFPEISDETLLEIKKINDFLNYSIQDDKDDNLTNNKIQLKELWFDNLFSYGEDNYINFDSFKGLIGLFADNASGKSSLIQILLFTLYDRTTHSAKTLDVLNIDKDKLYTKLRFSINNIDYFIEKKGKKYTTNKGETTVKISTDFYYVDESDNKTILNGEQRRDTQKIISSYIGDLDTTTLTSFSLQGDNAGLINKTQAERKVILSKFLNIDIFEKLYLKAKDESKGELAILKNFRKKSTHNELLDYQIKLKKETEEEKTLKTDVEKTKVQLDVVTNNILKLTNQLKPVDTNLDINNLLNTQIELNENTSKFDDKLKNGNNDIKLIQENVNKQLELQNITPTENIISDINTLLDQSNITIQQSNKEIELLNEEILTTTKSLKGIIDVDDISIIQNNKERIMSEWVVANNDIDKHQTTINSLERDVVTINDEIQNIDIDKVNAELELLSIKEHELSVEHITLNSIKKDVSTTKDKMSKLEQLEYDEDCNFCMNNIFVKDAISTKEDYDKIINTLEVQEQVIEVLNDKISELNKSVQIKDKYDLLINNKAILKSEYLTANSNLSISKKTAELSNNKIIQIDKDIITYNENEKNKQYNLKFNDVISKLKVDIINIKSIISKQDDKNISYKNLMSDFNSLTMAYNDTKNMIILNENNIIQNTKDIDAYRIVEVDLKYNDGINVQIIKSKAHQEIIKKSLLELENNHKECYLELNSTMNKIEELENAIKTIQAHEKTYEAYEYYLKAIDKNGIQYNLIRQIIPLFELEVNNILNQIAPFNLKFSFDKKNINIQIKYSDRLWNVSLASGMEKFLSSIAMRVTLDKFSSQPSLANLFIDEGFDVLDSKNKFKLDDLFTFLTQYYDFILVISHLEIMKDVMTDFISIDKVKGHSHIKGVA